MKTLLPVTMPVESLPVRAVPLHFRVLQQYLVLLKKYPILTKSVTSGILSALGNLLSQILEARKKAKRGIQVNGIDAAGAARYAVYGLFITGPVSHFFYQLMEAWMPTTDPLCVVKRLLLDRLIFAPGFLLLFYFVMNILEVGLLRNCPIPPIKLKLSSGQRLGGFREENANKLLDGSKDELESLDALSVHKYQLCACSVSSSVRQHDRLVLVCLSCIGEEMMPSGAEGPGVVVQRRPGAVVVQQPLAPGAVSQLGLDLALQGAHRVVRLHRESVGRPVQPNDDYVHDESGSVMIR
ncbi:unnamed protein product [Menidia menidia]|uniref:(Atlantic silverside) hypothetical protein n=1 Tax=Menidia menidia TaxID=238744 RepID=A0A8S4AYH2_9TELE|nr:unnamed protein product [Menidia menidia]